jgi:zinc transporter 2
MTHAGSLISDLVAFIINMLTTNIIEKKASKKYTYGWHRAHVVGSLMSLIFTVILNLYLLEEAGHRCFMSC